jgi:3-methyladenine DNA glycosylase/8-oxoguanine DNA glycosylase
MFSYDIRFGGLGAKAYNINFARTHYNIYPWVDQGEALLRLLRLPVSGVPCAGRIVQTALGLLVHVVSPEVLSSRHIRVLRDRFKFCLGLDADYGKLEMAAITDPVLAAALAENVGIRPKRYGEIFESICGAICAQNVDFRRLYKMMELLAKNFGPRLDVDGVSYWAFPTANEIAHASVDDIRRCKVGYRAERIYKASQWFSQNPAAANLTAGWLRAMQKNAALDAVCQVPGIGPYSAAIVLSAGAGRPDIFHLDSFTRHILREMYFHGRDVTDDELRLFVDTRWPGFGGSIAHVLTTNTERWARHLGYQGFRRSGARTE